MKIAVLLPLEDNDFKVLETYDKSEKIVEEQNSFLVSLLLQLMMCGHKLYIFSMSTKKEHIYKGRRLEIRTIQIGKHGNIRALLNFRPDINALSKALKEVDCDIYQVHWCYEYATAALNVCENKTIVTMHDWPEVIGVYLNNFFWRRRLSLGKRNVLRGNRFVAVSPYMKKYLDSVGKDAVLIPNYIDKSRIIEERREYNFEAPRIVNISNGFDERKNTKNCLKMFTILHDIIPKASLIMIGSSYGQGEAAERWSKENGMSEGVVFMGRLSPEQVYCELSKSEVLVSTSREESFGLTLIEAMASRCLAVGGAKSGAVPWVLNNGKAGLLVDVENPDKIAKDIAKVLYDRNRYLEYIEQGIKHIKSNFTLDAVLEKYNSMYDEVSNL